MELYQLRAFATVAQTGHLTRAAERLHVSQPALSGQIKALEQRLDVKLFERAPGGMVLTDAGRQLLPHALQALAAAEQLKRTATQLTGDLAGTLRVGTVSDPDSVRLGVVLASALARYPHLELIVHHEVSGAALEGVRGGRLDAAYYFGDAPGAEVASLELSRIAYRVALPPAWSDQAPPDDWQAIAALPWVLTPAISTYHSLVRTLFAGHGELPQRHVEADNESVFANLVASGVGVSLLREDVALAKEAAGEVRIWGAARVATTLWFIAAAERAEEPLIAALFGLVQESWQAGDQDTKLADENAVAV
jgi:DNA-binding transcriptional LysR family regulator